MKTSLINRNKPPQKKKKKSKEEAKVKTKKKRNHVELHSLDKNRATPACTHLSTAAVQGTLKRPTTFSRFWLM
eukprot:m.64910 g.64910  ORF g.64910 m.64910 type:complete len:73 (-) comp16457_c0_seq1:2283-2501(-)